MKINCKRINEELRALIRGTVAESGKDIRLAIIKAPYDDQQKDAQADAFLRQKRACGKEVGIDVREYDIHDSLVSQKKFEERVSEIARIPKNDAVIIQLPLPCTRRSDNSTTEINTQAVLNSIPPKKDADVLHAESFGRYEAGSNTALVPPPVGAMEVILKREMPDVLQCLQEKVVVIVGQGLVIGKQMNRWAIRNKVRELHCLREESDVARYAREADIIISGAGRAGLITPDMVKEDVIIFDFGCSKENGAVKGDVDPTVADKAYLTPVPGGMGPLAVTMLFWNTARIGGAIKNN